VRIVKKASISIVTIAVLMIAVAAFAHPWGAGSAWTQEQQEFFGETKDLRKQMHDKRFELMELYRTPDADSKKIAELEKDLNELRTEIRKKANVYDLTRGYGPGNCGGPGRRFGKGQAYKGGYDNCESCLQNQPYQGRGFGYGRMMW
jgi:hypothetical protein